MQNHTEIPTRLHISFMQVAAILALCAGIGISASAQNGRPITVDDLLGFERIGSPRVSPDGAWIAYVVETHSPEQNSITRHIYLLDRATGATRQLTTQGSSNTQPSWLDARTLAFVSNREEGPQVWKLDVQGGEPSRLTWLSTGAGGLRVSPDGSMVLFASEVDPDCPDDDCNKHSAAEAASRKSSGMIFESLPYRVWNYWKDGKRSHLFAQRIGERTAIDLTPGDHDVPPIDLGGAWDYDISPDGREVAFTMNVDPLIAASTNNDIYIVPSTGGEAVRISSSKGGDAQPTYSPDGRYISFVSMERAGFEADRKVLMLYDRSGGTMKAVTHDLDLSVNETVWSPDAKSIFITAASKGTQSILRVDAMTGTSTPVLTTGSNSSVSILPDGSGLVFLHHRMDKPAEIYTASMTGGDLQQVTFHNKDRVASLLMSPPESFWFLGADGDSVHGYLVRPPGFTERERYPMTFLIHGGPQGQWADQFHYRWNAQMFASRGHVVVLINPRGSTGYGQAFTDAISRDWGGAVYEDLMKGLDHVIARYHFIDPDRVAAAGASYGGYMINWLATATEQRFRCLVNHDGVFNPWSMYGSTEELWFPEWEFGGTPYEHPELYDAWSPLRRAKNMRTPMLVIHGQRDYRVDVSEGFQVFTALQRQGLPSKMLYFPDEGHWVQKPANARLWWTTVLDWIDHYTKQ